jgi:hypothetical protein
MAARHMQVLRLPLRRLSAGRARGFASAPAATGRRKSLLVDGNNVLYHFYDPLSTIERFVARTACALIAERGAHPALVRDGRTGMASIPAGWTVWCAC